MSRNPFDPVELDREDAGLARTAERLERYAAGVEGAPPPDLASRIVDAIEREPAPPVGWWAGLTSALAAWRRPAAALAAAAVVVAIVMAVVAVGDLFERVRNVGASPVPSVLVTPSLTPTPSPTPSPTPTPSSTPTPSPTPAESSSVPSVTVAPTASDDDHGGGGTPEPSDDSESGGSSGPGGGDD